VRTNLIRSIHYRRTTYLDKRRRAYCNTVSALGSVFNDQQLIHLGFDVMLPMTFCVENLSERDRIGRQGMVLNSKASNPAIFLGFLATSAAHRAVWHGRHKDLGPSPEDHDGLITDPDFIKAKHEATVAVRQLFNQSTTLQQSMIEASFGLISTATVVGNFEEAKLHLKSVERMKSRIQLSPETMLWLPLANNKVSVGMLERPVMPLLIARKPLPSEILTRIQPHPLTSMSRLGMELVHLDQISNSLRNLLSAHTSLCHFCEANATTTPRASQSEMAVLTHKAVELEHDLVAYPYEDERFPQNSNGDPELPPFESLIRLAALGMLSLAPHTIMPSTGNGRALTHHQRRALDLLMFQWQAGGVTELKALCWVLFVFIQNSLRQPEEVYFRDILLQVSHDLHISTWEEAQHVVLGFLYIPSLQASVWRGIWADIQSLRDRFALNHITQ
jgi:hypothetical protein